MHYRDLRDFIAQLQSQGELRRISAPVSPHLEMTALADRVLRSGGPALLFENPTGHTMPVLANLFGTPQRVARALGVAGLPEIRAFGGVLAARKEPEPPRGMKDLWGRRDLIKTLRLDGREDRAPGGATGFAVVVAAVLIAELPGPAVMRGIQVAVLLEKRLGVLRAGDGRR